MAEIEGEDAAPATSAGALDEREEDSQQLDSQEAQRLEKRKKEKESVVIHSHGAKRRTAWEWGYVFPVSLASGKIGSQDLTPAETSASLPNTVICKLCFDDEGTPLSKALVKMCASNAHNANSHFQHHHNPLWKEKEAKKEEEKEAKKQKASTKDGPMSKFVTPTGKSAARASNVVSTPNAPQTRFINDAAIPERNLFQAPFRSMIMCAVDHGRELRKAGHQPMGKHTHATTMLRDFEFMRTSIASLVTRCRSKYIKFGNGRHFPFISVGHDIWDSTDKEILGISLFLIDPNAVECHQLAVALIETDSKKSKDVAGATLKCLERYGIKQGDVCRAVNDTTNSAVAAGRMMVDSTQKKTDASCRMHVVDLMIGHATGLKTRSSNREIVDEFPEFVSLHKGCRNVVSCIQNKKAKKRYQDFVRVNKEERKSEVVKFELPNDTRVAGVSLFFESFIRGKFSIACYGQICDKVSEINPSNKKYHQVAQYVAVLKPLAIMTKDVQCDRPGGLGVSLLLTVTLKNLYENTQTFQMVDMYSSAWEGNTLFGDLPMTTLAKQEVVVDSSEDGDDDNEKPVLMTANTVKLLDRITKESSNYLGKPEDDQLLALACHPLMATMGIDNMRMIDSELGANVKELAKQKLIAVILDTLQNKANDTEESSTASLAASQDGDKDNDAHDDDPMIEDDDDDDDDDYDNMFRHLSAPVGNAAPEPTSKSFEDIVSEQVDSFFNLSVNWKDELKLQGKDVESQPLKKNLKKRNALLLDKEFDLLDWWKKNGQRFGLIHCVACLIFGKPDSNGYQERTFSSCTRTNSNKLRKRLSVEKFEMNILLAANRAWTDKEEKMAKADNDMNDEDYIKNSFSFFHPNLEWNDDTRNLAKQTVICEEEEIWYDEEDEDDEDDAE